MNRIDAAPACGHEHELVGAAPGERLPDDAPRLWRVGGGGLVATLCSAYPNGPEVRLEPATRLRYDQRDYDASWRHEGWDRFLVLDGAHAGSCVCVRVPMPASPVAGGIEPAPAHGAPPESPEPHREPPHRPREQGVGRP